MDRGAIKVLMLGGPRVGKSSMLASLVDVMLGGEFRDIIYVKDTTADQRDSLSAKIKNLKALLAEKRQKTILVDTDKTNTEQRYSLQFILPETEHSMDMVFTDINGEDNVVNARQSERNSRLKQLADDSDVLLVAIDTPFLMEAMDFVNDSHNRVENIHSILVNIDLNRPRLVVFVPIKCEKWASEGHIDEVTAKVENVYGKTIRHFAANANATVMILPVQTAGGIVFRELLDEPQVFTANGKMRRCNIVDNGKRIRFEDGEERKLLKKDGPYLADDPRAVFQDIDSYLRPNAWYDVVSSDYAPHNCEQLAYHIILFMLNCVAQAVRRDELRKQNMSPWERIKLTAVKIALIILSAWDVASEFGETLAFLLNKLGDITEPEIQRVVNRLKSQRMIKTSGDGIKIFRKQ